MLMCIFYVEGLCMCYMDYSVVLQVFMFGVGVVMVNGIWLFGQFNDCVVQVGNLFSYVYEVVFELQFYVQLVIWVDSYVWVMLCNLVQMLVEYDVVVSFLCFLNDESLVWVCIGQLLVCQLVVDSLVFKVLFMCVVFGFVFCVGSGLFIIVVCQVCVMGLLGEMVFVIVVFGELLEVIFVKGEQCINCLLECEVCFFGY